MSSLFACQWFLVTSVLLGAIKNMVVKTTDGADDAKRKSICEFCLSPQNDFLKKAALNFAAGRFGFPSARPARK